MILSDQVFVFPQTETVHGVWCSHEHHHVEEHHLQPGVPQRPRAAVTLLHQTRQGRPQNISYIVCVDSLFISKITHVQLFCFRISATLKIISLQRWKHSFHQEKWAQENLEHLIVVWFILYPTIVVSVCPSLQPKSANVLGAVNKPLASAGKQLQSKASRMETTSNDSSSNPGSPQRSKTRWSTKPHLFKCQ